MNKFRKPHGGGGNRGFGGGGAGRPSFGGGGRPSRPPFSNSREESGQKFDATCAECGKPCQVPFRPNGKKPVYCSNCFAIQRGESPRDDGAKRDFPSAAKREFSARPSAFGGPHEPHAPHGDDRAIAEMKRQMDIMNSKVDVIMRMLQDAHRAPAPAAAAAVAPIVSGSTVAVTPMKNPKGTFRADAAKKKATKKKGPVKK